jgi:response regulator RpfG family c-di-GMP phosphodiesterase
MFADTFDAMTTKRPYRGPMGEEEIREELVRCRGRQFDPGMADKLLASDFWRTLFPPVNRAHTTPRFMHIIAGGSRR